MPGRLVMLGTRELEREVRRVFRRLVEPECYAAQLAGGGFGVFVPRNKWRKPVVQFCDRTMRAFAARDLICERRAGDGAGMFFPSEAGRACYRRLQAGAEPFRAQHQIAGTRMVRHGASANTHHLVNEAETPLGWLRRRKGAGGRPLIGDAEYDAGERLREDFTLASLTPRVTADWSMTLGPRRGKGARTGAGVDPRETALAAKRRFARALDAVGPGLSDVLVDVCCHLTGLEQAERQFGWPQRSGKVVLQIALDRLARHYGLKRGAPARIRSWADMEEQAES